MATFDVILSNLCLHNIYDRETRRRAVEQIVRVLKPGGVAILSDYKLTGEYAAQLQNAGLLVERRWGNPLYTFPPLRIVVARKAAGSRHRWWRNLSAYKCTEFGSDIREFGG